MNIQINNVLSLWSIIFAYTGLGLYFTSLKPSKSNVQLKNCFPLRRAFAPNPRLAICYPVLSPNTVGNPKYYTHHSHDLQVWPFQLAVLLTSAADCFRWPLSAQVVVRMIQLSHLREFRLRSLSSRTWKTEITSELCLWTSLRVSSAHFVVCASQPH